MNNVSIDATACWLKSSFSAETSWLDSLSHSVVVVDARSNDMPIIAINRAFTDLTGYGPEEAIGKNCRFLQGLETDASVIARIHDLLLRGLSVHEEILNYTRDGRKFWNEMWINPIRNDAGEITHFISVQSDISNKRAAVDRAQSAEKRLDALVSGLPGFVFQLEQQQFAVESFTINGDWLTRKLKLPPDETIDWHEFVALLHPLDRDNLLHMLDESGRLLTSLRSDFRLVALDGSEHWFRAMATPGLSGNGTLVWEGLALDIQTEKSSESRLAYLVGHDTLTGLSNRLQFRNALAKALHDIAPMRERVALFTVSLEDFQALYDAMGQRIGDQLLRRVAVRLREIADKYQGIAARLAEDEFGLLLPRIPARQRAREIADSILAVMLFPNFIDGQEICLQACVGGVVSSHGELHLTPDEERPTELLKQAHLALYVARQEGAGAYRLYAAEFDDRVRNRVALSQSLQRAISEEQFEVHYQPLVDLASGRIVGAEALVRWSHPSLGMQRPDVFIPLAESSGLIVPLGNWVMKQVMRRVVEWSAKGIKPPRIAINLSSVQLRRPGLIAAVRKCLRETGANPSNFGFELTEGVFLESSPEIRLQLETLRAMGFELALDDFGTGHSTFKYLRDFPVQKIKIDQTFVRQLVIDSSDASIVRAIIAVCRKLDRCVVAEGIETEVQREFLHSEGCLVGQGYLFSLPMVADDFAWLLTNNTTLPLQASVADKSVLGER